MQINERLMAVFQQVFEDPALILTAETTANDIELWDSIAHITLIFAIEEEFQIQFSTKDLEHMQNVGDLQSVISGLSR